MGFSEDLRAKIAEKIPIQIKKPAEKRIEEYKQSRAERREQEKVLRTIEKKARYTEERRQAQIRGQEQGEKGPITRQIGKAFMKELTKERTAPSGRQAPEFIESQFLGRQNPSRPNVVTRPKFAPSREERPFLKMGDREASGLSQGFDSAFPGTTRGVRGVLSMHSSEAPARPLSAVERAFFGQPKEPTVVARKRMIRGKRKPMF